jgi:hypothetical protein
MIIGDDEGMNYELAMMDYITLSVVQIQNTVLRTMVEAGRDKLRPHASSTED